MPKKLCTLLKIKHEVARQAPLFPASDALRRADISAGNSKPINITATFSLFLQLSLLLLRALRGGKQD